MPIGVGTTVNQQRPSYFEVGGRSGSTQVQGAPGLGSSGGMATRLPQQNQPWAQMHGGRGGGMIGDTNTIQRMNALQQKQALANDPYAAKLRQYDEAMRQINPNWKNGQVSGVQNYHQPAPPQQPQPMPQQQSPVQNFGPLHGGNTVQPQGPTVPQSVALGGAAGGVASQAYQPQYGWQWYSQ